MVIGLGIAALYPLVTHVAIGAVPQANDVASMRLAIVLALPALIGIAYALLRRRADV